MKETLLIHVESDDEDEMESLRVEDFYVLSDDMFDSQEANIPSIHITLDEYPALW